MSDLITLAMPVYNVAEYLEKSLLSALNQTYDNIEYLLIYDKSTDGTKEVMMRVLESHPRGRTVRIIEDPVNIGGLGGARNTAIENATGKYLFFLDSDDEMSLNCLQLFYEEAIRTGVDIVWAKTEYVSSNNVMPWGNQEPKYFEPFLLQGNTQIINCLLGHFITAWNVLYKTSFLIEHDIRCTTRSVEDEFFTFQVLLNATSISLIPDITYYYLIRGDSLMNVWTEKSFLQALKMVNDQYAYIQRFKFDGAIRLKIKKYLLSKRMHFAKRAYASENNVQQYIDGFLNIQFLKDADTLRSLYLLAGFILSVLPLCLKKALLKIRTKLTNKQLH